MSFILVEVKTDHDDHEAGVRSVCNALKRAGYNVTDYQYEEGESFSAKVRANGIVMAEEPEVTDNKAQLKTPQEKREFTKAWDERVEKGRLDG